MSELNTKGLEYNTENFDLLYAVLKEWELWFQGKSSKTLSMIHDMRIEALDKAEGK